MRILAIGDIVGSVTVKYLEKNLWRERDTRKIDFVIANGENAAEIRGINSDEAKRLFDAAMDRSAPKTWIRALGTLIVCFSFTAFFGGGIGDCLAALLVGIGMFGMEMLSARLSVNRVLYNFNASFVAGLLAILTVLLGIGNSVDHIMFGVIMLLIPGASLTGSIENLMVGDTLSGLMGIAEAIIKSLALAAGVALSLMLLGGLL